MDRAVVCVFLALLALAAGQQDNCDVTVGANCFVLGSTEVNWAAANTACRNRGGTLASVKDIQEHDALRTLAQANNFAGLWLGGLEIKTDWRWTDGSYIQLQGCYENSGVDQPTNLASDNITPSSCVNECEVMRFAYAAIQTLPNNEITCTCGNSYNINNQVKGCTRFCKADGNLRCGGQNKQHVYRVDAASGLFLWYRDQPNNFQPYQECLALVSGNGYKWGDERCHIANNYICQYSETGSCKYIFEADTCYELVNTSLSWHEAKFDCRSRGGDLMKMHRQDQYDAIKPRVDQSRKKWWLGGTNRRWSWTRTGAEILFSKWGDKQPDKPTESCMVMRRSPNNYDWDDVECTEDYNYACQLGTVVIDPTRPQPPTPRVDPPTPRATTPRPQPPTPRATPPPAQTRPPVTQCPAILCVTPCQYGFKKDIIGCNTCDCNPPPPTIPGPVQCPAIMCVTPCQYGLKKDINGCDTCDCNPPPPTIPGPVQCPVEACAEFCPYGLKKDSNGCDTCECNPPPPTTAGPETTCSPIRCRMACENGFEKDQNGCEICKCKAICSNIQCFMFCKYGFQKDDKGCDICRCNDKPKCDEKECRMRCPNGFQEDSNGCKVCMCKSFKPDKAEFQETDCQPGTCRKWCPFGFKKDDKGCEICACKDNPCVGIRCRTGFECEARRWRGRSGVIHRPYCKPRNICSQKCYNLCEYGYETDDDGCPSRSCRCRYRRCYRGDDCYSCWRRHVCYPFERCYARVYCYMKSRDD